MTLTDMTRARKVYLLHNIFQMPWSHTAAMDANNTARTRPSNIVAGVINNVGWHTVSELIRKPMRQYYAITCSVAQIKQSITAVIQGTCPEPAAFCSQYVRPKAYFAGRVTTVQSSSRAQSFIVHTAQRLGLCRLGTILNATEHDDIVLRVNGLWKPQAPARKTHFVMGEA